MRLESHLSEADLKLLEKELKLMGWRTDWGFVDAFVATEWPERMVDGHIVAVRYERMSSSYRLVYTPDKGWIDKDRHFSRG